MSVSAFLRQAGLTAARADVVNPERLRRDVNDLVFAMQAQQDGAALTASFDELEALIDAIAAEANHEPNRRRRRRLDAAFEELNRLAGIS